MGTGEVIGIVVDEDGLSVPFVRVLVFSSGDINSEIKAGAVTDFDGYFRISNLWPGTYDIEFNDEYSGRDTIRLTNVEIRPDRITFLDQVMSDPLEIICCFGPWPIPSIQLDPFGGPTIIKSEDIRMR